MTKNSYILRDLEQKLEILINKKQKNHNVILVEGARQVGKTSLVRHVCQNRTHIWIDLQKDRSLMRQIDQTQSFEEFTDLLALEKGFRPSSGKILIIDEAQESHKLGEYVRYMKEDWANQVVILMGSLIHRLFRKGVKYPVGRVQRFPVYPFSFREFLRALDENYLHEKITSWSLEDPFHSTLHTKALETLSLYLQIGGLPAVVLAYKNKQDWQDKLIELSFDYIEDYKRIEGEERSNLFELCLKRVAETLGSQSKLSTIVAVNQPGYRQVPDILNLLENWKLIDKIPIETPQQTRNNKIPPKRYLFDLGIRQRFSPISGKITNFLSDAFLLHSPYYGGVIENFVLNELRSCHLKDISCWREKPNGSEIDFLVKTPTALYPFEVKTSLKTNQKFLISLKRFFEHHPSVKTGFLINGEVGKKFQVGKKTIQQIPFYAVNHFSLMINTPSSA